MRTWRRSWTQKSSRCSRLSSTRQMRRLWQPQTHKLPRLQQAWRLTANRWYRKVSQQKNPEKEEKYCRANWGDILLAIYRPMTPHTCHSISVPTLKPWTYFFSLHFEFVGTLADFIQEEGGLVLMWNDPAAGLDSVITRRMRIHISDFCLDHVSFWFSLWSVIFRFPISYLSLPSPQKSSVFMSSCLCTDSPAINYVTQHELC